MTELIIVHLLVGIVIELIMLAIMVKLKVIRRR